VDLAESSTLVTGASGLGRATAEALVSRGAFVTIVDLPTSSGQEAAGKLGCGPGSRLPT
jgi:NAD(P)-dependent dehydrogenase (short-subunit alcohol dehydrogenase family)